ncbi:MAG: VWA domain-containing protein [Elusimicrobia bacterium]|nr:VWA domain-containing protein [Elusimicrobiota bacterium]
MVGELGLALLLTACGIDNELVPKTSEPDAPLETADTADTGISCLIGSTTDYFEQQIPNQMDVLFVVDNSGSMSAEQQLLASNFPLFLDYFQESESPIDYHIGVVTTDMDNSSHQGKLRDAYGFRYIDSDTPNADVVFSSMAKVGISGSSYEMGLDAISWALYFQKDYNAGFLRDTAGLHIVVVSDENDEYSATKKEQLAKELIELGQQRGQISSSSISPMKPNCSTDEGAEYLYLTEHVGGFSYPICLADWSPTLDDLGNQLVQLKKEFYLTQDPYDQTFTIVVITPDGTVSNVPAADYSYNEERNSIIFDDDKVPPEGSTIAVVYDTEICN